VKLNNTSEQISQTRVGARRSELPLDNTFIHSSLAC